MTNARSALSLKYLGVLAAAVLVLTSCAIDDPAAAPNTDGASASPSSSAPASGNNSAELVAEIDDPVEFEECKKAEQLEGATVEWLDDVVIEEQRIAAVEPQTVEIEGKAVEIPGAPALIIPERVGQAGCIIEYPAPGGCLPAVEISGAFIPGYRIPERRLERVELPDGTVFEEAVQQSITIDAVQHNGVRAEQVCQTEPDDAQDGDIVAMILRDFISRPYMISQPQLQHYESQGGTTSNSGAHINLMALDSYTTEPIWFPATHVPVDYLEAYVVEGADHTEYAERDERIAYTTEGDVLFDSDDHELRADATGELQAIADDIAERGDDVTIRVEGHTDDLPSQKYADNTELSESRAESVLTWLTNNTDIEAADMTAEGLGDKHPRASNSSDAGRQQNRRVVITVTPKDHQPNIEYEVDNSQTPAQ